MDFGSVNFLAVLAGAVVNMVLGFLWYGPFFGKLWMKLIDKKPEEIKSKPSLYILSFIGAFLGTMVLAVIIAAFGSSTFIAGGAAGILLWVVAAAVTLTYSIFEGPKLSVWLLFALYQIVVLFINGGIIAIW
jgi:hypothetical protein